MRGRSAPLLGTIRGIPAESGVAYIERFRRRIGQVPGLASRCDRSPENVHASLGRAAIRLWFAAN
jgi:hypothetical protein